MSTLSSHEIVIMLLSLGTLLLVARVFGELAVRLGQPSVIGEILAGIVLGPTVFGNIAPGCFSALFPSAGGPALVLKGLTTLGICLFILVAGMEVELSTIWKRGRSTMIVSVLGMVFPFCIGFVTAWFTPGSILGGGNEHAGQLTFSLFLANALSISALPVIAKTLFDLKLYRSDIGMIIIASAIFNDLLGWIVFSIIISMMDTGTGAGHPIGVQFTILFILIYAVLMLTLVRWAIDRILPWMQAHLTWPGGGLSFILATSLLGAAFTEWIGVHAVFGSFLFGIAVGDSPHLKEQTRQTIDRFVSFFFAPIFFASIGLRVDFLVHFDIFLVLIVFVIATIGKLVGCGLGAKLSGLSTRMSLAIGIGMNARGSMEIILGLLALQYGIIKENMFVALVVMAIVTSMMSGPLMQRILQRKKTLLFTDYLSRKAFHPLLKSMDQRSAMSELLQTFPLARFVKQAVIRTIVEEEGPLIHSGIGNGIAIFYGRIEGLSAPVVGAGISPFGIYCDAPDGKLINLIFLVLTPRSDDELHFDLLNDITRRFDNKTLLAQAIPTKGHSEFIALFKTAQE